MRCGGGSNGHEAGYSLVELLIVLALLGILSILLVSGLTFGTRAWEVGQRSSVAVREIAIAQARLRLSLSETYPFLSTVDPTRPRIEFDGEKQRLSFLAVDRASRTAGRSRIKIERQDNEVGVNLVLRSIPELSLDTAADPPSEALIRDIATVSFAYLRVDGTAWADVWLDEKVLPRLVRVTVTFREGDRRVWPTFVVAPRLAADVSCTFDPLTKSCRGR